MTKGSNPVPFEIKVSSSWHHYIYLRIHQTKSQASLPKASNNADKQNLGSAKQY